MHILLLCMHRLSYKIFNIQSARVVVVADFFFNDRQTETAAAQLWGSEGWFGLKDSLHGDYTTQLYGDYNKPI